MIIQRTLLLLLLVLVIVTVPTCHSLSTTTTTSPAAPGIVEQHPQQLQQQMQLLRMPFLDTILPRHSAIAALHMDDNDTQNHNVRRRPRSRLQPHDEALFFSSSFDDDDDDLKKYLLEKEEDDDDDNQQHYHHYLKLFDQLGRVCCRTGVVSRKEFLETFAAAYAIYTTILQHNNDNDNNNNVYRVADLAAGHGLLAWFLLVMADADADPVDATNDTDDTENADGDENRPMLRRRHRRLTAVCVDRCMPPAAADKIAACMEEVFPQFAVATEDENDNVNDNNNECWTYIQADLAACQPHPSCLLASVHACGSLTDDIIQMAIAYGTPCAIVPCCHSVRHTGQTYRPHPRLANVTVAEVAQRIEERKRQWKFRNEISMDAPPPDDNDIDAKHMIVANVVDEVRCQTLQRAGFTVQEVQLPKAFTKRNRLLLATPPKLSSTSLSSSSFQSNSPTDRTTFYRRQSPPILQPIDNNNNVRIPLADDPASRSQCRAIARGKGRAPKEQRLVQRIPRQYSLTLSLSIWLSPPRPPPSSSTSKSIFENDKIPSTKNHPGIEPQINEHEKSTPFRAVTLQDLQILVDKVCSSSFSSFCKEGYTGGINSSGATRERRDYGLQCKVELPSSAIVIGDCDDDDAAARGRSCKDGRCSQLYRFQYTRSDGGNMSGDPRIQAKSFHYDVVKNLIVAEFGDILR